MSFCPFDSIVDYLPASYKALAHSVYAVIECLLQHHCLNAVDKLFAVRVYDFRFNTFPKQLC